MGTGGGRLVMNSLNFLRIALVALLGMSAAACLPVTSKTPLGTTAPTMITPEPALAGVWKGRIGTGDVFSFLTFFPQDDGTVSAVIVTPPSAKDKGGWGAFTLQTVTLGPYHFMNVRETISDGKPGDGTMANNTTPVLYRVNGDGAIVLYIIDETAAKNAIKSGKIAGTIDPGDYGDTTLTATPGDLDTFMASPAGRALFVKPLGILRRVK
jgi:hypothetical protein